MSRDAQNEPVNEETALLGQRKHKTPLPYGQIAIILLMQICEPLASQSIYPYINQLVSELDITGGDEKKVGYYAGLIESLFFVTQAFTVLQWSRASDRVGRKPILLIGLVGGAVSMLCFGLSRTFWTLVLSRCLTGLLNGNVGVMKSTMGDLTDQSNRAEGFSLMPVVWSIGATLGPLLGGTFARPQDRFPNAFKGRFWRDFPYFMPCIVVSSFILTVVLVSVIFLKESAPRKRRSRTASTDSEVTIVASQANINGKHDGPLPLRDLLVFPVVISVSSYVYLAFLDIAFIALLPLFLAMPIEIGGLNLPPAAIGYIMGGYGAVNGIFQFFYFAKITRWLGERRMFLNGISTFVLIFASMPLCNVFARNSGGMNVWSWGIVVLIVVLAVIMDLAYGAIFMFVTSSAPNKNSLGATNGLSQTVVSIARAIGPAMATSLFSFSVQENILGGYGVYALFCALSVGGVLLGTQLPKRVWDDPEE
ncbi:hypothetical protein V5O48_008726 [Marasmius crinis-equi]|uniref:Major facilitator superfamily (MFS) profile domain-containing protein n=1 Tax=Marasmius crinis-equi TaxID=585013 RepID=A0ABR3FD91_9AGAR